MVNVKKFNVMNVLLYNDTLFFFLMVYWVHKDNP